MTIIIRDLEKGDLKSLVILLDEFNQVLEQKRELHKKNIESQFLSMKNYPNIYSNYIAIKDDQIIGFISIIFYKSFLHEGGTALINELIVAKNHKNKGIGKLLIEKAVQLAINKGMDEIEVGTEKTNFNAQQFYKKMEFTEEYILLGREFES